MDELEFFNDWDHHENSNAVVVKIEGLLIQGMQFIGAKPSEVTPDSPTLCRTPAMFVGWSNEKKVIFYADFPVVIKKKLRNYRSERIRLSCLFTSILRESVY